MTYKDKRIYDGEWSLDKRNGEGRIIFLSGSIYFGKFENNMPVGEGKWSFKINNNYKTFKGSLKTKMLDIN